MDGTELKKFFDSFVTEADLTQLVSDRAQENIHLEYKQKRNRSNSQLEDSDASQFSRALSGFANSDGGVLFWGIESDKEERANQLKPITGHREFQGRLKKSLLNSVQPTVDDVLIEVIDSDDSPHQGYVKCYVPTSEKTPHRAMWAGREYYKRSTEGFYRLEHFDLEDMFGRRPIPSLRLRARVVQAGSGGSPRGEMMRGYAIIAIENIGRGSARAPYLALDAVQEYSVSEFGLDGNGNEGLPRLYTGSPRRLVYTSSDIVIHPGVTHEVTAFKVHGYVQPEGGITMPVELRCRYELAAENARMQTQELVISAHEIALGVFPDRLYLREGQAAPKDGEA